jgi:hypothetical protein
MVTLLAIKALMGPREAIRVYDPRYPNDSLYTRLEVMRHRNPITLGRHVAALRARGLVETFNHADDNGPYLRLRLPQGTPPPGKKRAPFIRIDLSLMRYCRLLMRCVMSKAKEGWETVFISWVCLKRFEDRRSGLCCPSYRTLAAARGRHPMTIGRHVGLLWAAGIIHRDRQPWPTRRHRTRYRSNHYVLIAPGALLRFENDEVVLTNTPKLKTNLDARNQIEKRGLDPLEGKGESSSKGCTHTLDNALPHPMWMCRACGDIFEAVIR